MDFLRSVAPVIVAGIGASIPAYLSYLISFGTLIGFLIGL